MMPKDVKKLLTFIFDAEGLPKATDLSDSVFGRVSQDFRDFVIPRPKDEESVALQQETACPAGLACQNAFSAYIDAELNGKDASARFPYIRAHLDSCPSCQEFYEEMKALLYARRKGQLLSLPYKPDFDLPALSLKTRPLLPEAPKEQAIWKAVERAGKQVAQLLTELRVVLSQGQAAFEQLPNPLVAELALVPMSNRRSSSERQVPALSLPWAEHDLSLRLIVTPSESEKRVATLGVEVKQISSGLLVSRARVTIRDAEYHMLESDFTREEGRVDFTDVKLGSYVIEVKYQGRIQQIPITLT